MLQFIHPHLLAGCLVFSILGHSGTQAEDNTSVNPRVNGSNIEFTSEDERCYLIEHATSLDGQWTFFEFLRATGTTSSVPVTVDTPECFFRIRPLEAEIANARALWAKAGIDTYVMSVTRNGTSAGPVTGKNLYIEIKTNELTTAIVPSESRLLEPDERSTVLLMEQWYNVIETSLTNPDADILLIWDESGAVPVRFRVETSSGVLIDMSMSIEDTFHRLVACRLAAARLQWETFGRSNYRADYDLFCFCFFPEGFRPPTSLRVTNATEVVSATYLESGNEVNIPRYKPTVLEMFDRVEEMMRPNYALNVTFDRQTGYVRKLFTELRNDFILVDGIILTSETADDEVTVTYSLR